MNEHLESEEFIKNMLDVNCKQHIEIMERKALKSFCKKCQTTYDGAPLYFKGREKEIYMCMDCFIDFLKTVDCELDLF